MAETKSTLENINDEKTVENLPAKISKLCSNSDEIKGYQSRDTKLKSNTAKNAQKNRIKYEEKKPDRYNSNAANEYEQLRASLF